MQKDFGSSSLGSSSTTTASSGGFPTSPMMHPSQNSPMITPSHFHQQSSWGMNEFGPLLTSPFDEPLFADTLCGGIVNSPDHQHPIFGGDGFNQTAPSTENYYFGHTFHRPSFDYQLNNDDPLCNTTSINISATINSGNGNSGPDFRHLSVSITAAENNNMAASAPQQQSSNIHDLSSNVNDTNTNVNSGHDQRIQPPISLLDDHTSAEDLHHNDPNNFLSLCSTPSDLTNPTNMFHDYHNGVDPNHSMPYPLHPPLSLLDTPTVLPSSSNDMSSIPDCSFDSLNSAIDLLQPTGVSSATPSNFSSNSPSSSKKHRESSRASAERSNRSTRHYDSSSSHRHKSGSSSKKSSSSHHHSSSEGHWASSNEYSSSSKRHRRHRHRHRSSSRRSPSRSGTSPPGLFGLQSSYSSAPERRRGLLVSGGSLNHSAYTLRGAAAASMYSGRPFNHMGASAYYEPVGGSLAAPPSSQFSMPGLPPPGGFSSPYSSQYLAAIGLGSQGSMDGTYSDYSAAGPSRPLPPYNDPTSYYTPLPQHHSDPTLGKPPPAVALSNAVPPQRLGYASSSPPSDDMAGRATKKQRIASSAEWHAPNESYEATQHQQSSLKNDFPSQQPSWQSPPLNTLPPLVACAPPIVSSSSAISSSGPPSAISSSLPSGSRAMSDVGTPAANRSRPGSPKPVDIDDDDDVVFERCVTASSQQFSQQSSSHQLQRQGSSQIAPQQTSQQQLPSSQQQQNASQTHPQNATTWGNPIAYPVQQPQSTSVSSSPLGAKSSGHPAPGHNQVTTGHQPYVVVGQEPSTTASVTPVSSSTPASSCSWPQTVPGENAPSKPIASAVVGSAPAYHDVSSQPLPFSHSTPISTDTNHPPRPTAVSIGMDVSQSALPQIPFSTVTPTANPAPVLPNLPSPPRLPSSSSTPLHSLQLVPTHQPPLHTPPAATQLLTPNPGGVVTSSQPVQHQPSQPAISLSRGADSSNVHPRPIPAVVQSSAPVVLQPQQQRVNCAPSVPAVAQSCPPSDAATPQSTASPERTKRKRTASKIEVKSEVERCLKRSKSEELPDPFEKDETKGGGTESKPEHIESKAEEPQDDSERPCNETPSETSGDISNEKIVDGSVTEVLATSLISVFNGIFTEEHKIKRKQLGILVSRFLPTAISPEGREAEEVETETQVQSSLLKRLLGSALDVYSCSWSELVRSQVESVKTMRQKIASIGSITSALLHCTSALCAALDHFISDWMFQLRLQSEILSIPGPKKVVYTRLVEHFLKPDLASRREHRVQTIEALFKTLPMVIEQQNQLSREKQGGDGAMSPTKEESLTDHGSSSSSSSQSSIDRLSTTQQHESNDHSDCGSHHGTTTTTSAFSDCHSETSSVTAAATSQPASDSGDDYGDLCVVRSPKTVRSPSMQCLESSLSDREASSSADTTPEVKTTPRRLKAYYPEHNRERFQSTSAFELTRGEHAMEELRPSDVHGSTRVSDDCMATRTPSPKRFHHDERTAESNPSQIDAGAPNETAASVQRQLTHSASISSSPPPSCSDDHNGTSGLGIQHNPHHSDNGSIRPTTLKDWRETCGAVTNHDACITSNSTASTTQANQSLQPFRLFGHDILMPS